MHDTLTHDLYKHYCTDSAIIDHLSSLPSSKGNQRPNIIFLLADDLGYGDVGYNGGFASTQNIDEMARGQHSIQFNQFYSGSPVCSPTRGTVLTGRNHNRYCIWSANTAGKYCRPQDDFKCPARYPLPQSEVTVAEILKEQGYRTAVFGKWHLGDLKPLSQSTALPASNPGQNGFDIWKVTERAVPTVTPNCGCYNTSQCILGHYKQRERIIPCTNYHSAMPGDPTKTLPHNGLIPQDDSNFIVNELLKFISNVTANGSTEQPFFAYVPFHAVHKNYIATPPFSLQYSSSRLLSQEHVDYFGVISAMDAAIGRIRSSLQEMGISSNTMLWFTSDNGPAIRSPGNTGGLRGSKGTLYEGGIRVPGIIEWPGVINSNRQVSTPVVTNDFLPTVCDILGIAPPVDRPLDGESILPLLMNKAGGNQQRRSNIKWAFRIKDGRFSSSYQVAVINGRNFKLIATYKKEKVTESRLYDLSEDPAESIDISAQHQDMTKELLKEVESWRLSVKESAISEVRCHTES